MYAHFTEEKKLVVGCRSVSVLHSALVWFRRRRRSIDIRKCPRDVLASSSFPTGQLTRWQRVRTCHIKLSSQCRIACAAMLDEVESCEQPLKPLVVQFGRYAECSRHFPTIESGQSYATEPTSQPAYEYNLVSIRAGELCCARDVMSFCWCGLTPPRLVSAFCVAVIRSSGKRASASDCITAIDYECLTFYAYNPLIRGRPYNTNKIVYDCHIRH